MRIAEAWNTAAAVLVSLGGGGAIVGMLSSWLGKVWADRLMQKDRARYEKELETLRSSLERSNRQVQAELEKTIFVTRVHFETEFKALADIWRYLAKLRAALENVQASYEDESQESRLSTRLDNLALAIEPFIAAVDQQSPFYPANIYAELNKLIFLVKAEGLDIEGRQRDAFTPEWFSRRRTKFSDFLAGVENVSNLIRERISKLSVYGIAPQSTWV